jgi:hypothetical protein
VPTVSVGTPLFFEELSVLKSTPRSECLHFRGVCRSGWPSGNFEVGEPAHRVHGGGSAHLMGRLQAATEGGAVGTAEDATAHVGVELHAGHAGRLAGGYLKGCVTKGFRLPHPRPGNVVFLNLRFVTLMCSAR